MGTKRQIKGNLNVAESIVDTCMYNNIEDDMM